MSSKNKTYSRNIIQHIYKKNKALEKFENVWLDSLIDWFAVISLQLLTPIERAKRTYKIT